MPCNSKGLSIRMPCSKGNFLWHIKFYWFSITTKQRTLYSFISIPALLANILASFIQEFYIYGCIGLILKVNHMAIRVIRSCQDKIRIRRNLQVEFIEDSLAFIYFTQLFLKVIGYIVCLERHFVITNIPYLHWEIITWEDVIIIYWWKLCSTNWINDICKEMLSRRIFFNHKKSGALIKLWTYTHITTTNIALARRKDKDIWAHWMIFYMGDDFC